MMIADACTLACEKLYLPTEDSWKNLGEAWPTLFISTELEMSEVQTMALAFITGISEEKFLLHQVDFNSEIVQRGIKILSEAPLYIEVLTDFKIKDIENSIRRNYRLHGVQAIFFDYINSSLGMLTEVAQQTRGVGMREDQILFLLSQKLKELAVDLNIFVCSATQTNASFKSDPIPDANLLKGQYGPYYVFSRVFSRVI